MAAATPSGDLAGGTKSTDALSSPAVASSAFGLIEPCKVSRPRPTRPQPAPVTTLAVALSGGGFRATLASLGVLRLLADAGLLGSVRYASSVSGGSIANGLFARHYPALEQAGFTGEAFDRVVLEPFVARVSRDSLVWKMVFSSWKILGARTRTHLLADSLAEWFFGDSALASLDSDVRFVFSAANLATGVRFTLEREVVGDYVSGYVETANTPLRLADAVAASAALPGALAPLVLKDLGLPCEQGRTPRIVDGGAYDNMGLEVLDSLVRGELIVAINAGGLFRTGTRFGRIPFIRDLSRASSLLYRQSTALRRRDLVERFRAWEQARELGVNPPSWARRGVLFGLSTTFAEPNKEWADTRDPRDDLRVPLALVKTTFARLARETCHGLVYRGWWLAGAALSTFHREVLGPTLPPWRDLAH